MRSFALAKGKKTFFNLRLEFEGDRAFVVWDVVNCGDYEFKTRFEIDPKRLRRARCRECDYVYNGQLDLPRPQDN